jgi:hypothetical protein
VNVADEQGADRLLIERLPQGRVISGERRLHYACCTTSVL